MVWYNLNSIIMIFHFHAFRFTYQSSGGNIAIHRWLKGEPSNGDGIENCVQIKNNGLNDRKCFISSQFICEFSKPV